ncbi:MAG: 16S rRNA (guanine(966)-N(2))-methyltransferase RsmD [Candidatus Saccharimonas sp.]|nr:16S rRNA (guanine(966)-N(2))-methyltransferase RsmD [Candidatus Saccharimonas sp.]
MSQIRVVSGMFGGRRLDAPAEGNTRTKPMGERIRNALFNNIGTEISGARVLDAFAGTGAIGFEALSRGASFVTFVERDKLAARILQNNMVSLGVEHSCEVVKTSINNWLGSSEPASYDIIFADPPYHDPQLSTVSKIFGLLKPNGLMVLSHPGRGEVPNLDNFDIVVVDNRSYGNAHLTFFRRSA